MVYFNELRIDEKTEKMIVDVSVLSEAKDTVYITRIDITNQDGINTTDPKLSKIIYSKTYEGTETKEAREIFDTVANKMYFVLVYWGGTPPTTTPCSMDSNPILAATVNTCPIYNKLLTQIKSFTQPDCSDAEHKAFINYYLQYKAMQIACDTEHYNEAITLYKKYFIEDSTTSSTCGCNKY